VLTEPRDLQRSELEHVLQDRWGLRDPQLDYLAVGFGSHHWRAVDSRGSDSFVTVDDLEAGTRTARSSCARCHEDKGVDRLSFLTTIRHLRTGPGLLHHLFAARRSPSFRANLLPQPPADVRPCRDRLVLGPCGTARGRCSRGGRSDHTRAACSEASRSETDRRRTRGGDRRQRGRRAVSMGRRLAGRRLRLLGARLLGIWAAGH
jgi:hypothetical protein